MLASGLQVQTFPSAAKPEIGRRTTLAHDVGAYEWLLKESYLQTFGRRLAYGSLLRLILLGQLSAKGLLATGTYLQHRD